MTRLTLLALMGSTLLATPALAQTAGPLALDPVTVTAARLPGPLARTPDAYVVTREDIDRRQSAFATDILATVPGVSITENGPFGGVSSLRLRGASADKTLVLIDGVPVNDPSQPAGGFDFSSLDVTNIERIEVLTGPQGALWGSDAIGGVVSLTSRELDGVSVLAEGGSLNTYRANLALGHATGRYAFGISLSNLRTDGISKADVRDGNTERDGFNTTTVAANMRVAFTDQVTLDARLRFNAAATEYDGFGAKTGVADSNDSSDIRNTSGYVRLRVKDLLGFSQELRADLMDLDRQYHGAFPFGAAGTQQLYRWAATRQETLWGASLGVEHKDAAENTGSGRQTRGANGYYAIGRLTPIAPLTITASVRHDDPQGYSGQTTGRIAAAYEAGAGFTLKGSAGQGYKAPSLFQTTYPCFECARPGPNRTLNPERAEGWDAGFGWRGGPVSLELTYFDLRVRDQINYVTGRGYANIDRVRSTGVEAGGEARLPQGFSLKASWTHDDAVDASTGKRLLKVPRDTGTASLGWQGHGFTGDVGLRAQGDAPDVYGAIRPYTVAYAAGAYALTREIAVTARIENLGDARYQQAYGYGEPGRLFMVGVKWTR